MTTVSSSPDIPDVSGRDEPDAASITQFIERFATSLIDIGSPRMPARVFTALLSTNSGGLTSAELADLLDISPAAVSGAVRYLSQVGLVTRERVPGTRRDRYVLFDDVWYTALVTKDQRLGRISAQLKTGVDLLGASSPAGRRLNENLEFFEFFESELALILERWKTRQSGPATQNSSASRTELG
jgi:DNA-binding transcriptional regulator GbsR (MarR family)